jgi:putative permease
MSAVVSATTLRRANRWKLIGVVLLLVLIFLVIISVDNLLVSSLVAFVIAYTIGPVVNYIERQGISRSLATLAVFAAMLLVLGLIAVSLAPYLGDTLSRLQADMPRYIAGLGQFVNEAEIKVHSIAGPLSNFDLTSRLENRLTLWTRDFFENLPAYIKTLFTVMLLGPFLAFFMVKDGRHAVRTVMGLAPNNLFETVLSLQHQINFQIGQFVRARILESLIVGGVTAIGLFLISFPYPLLLGSFAGLTNLIPYLGPILGAVPALLMALINGYTGLDVALLTLVYIVAQLIDAGLLIPMLVAKIVDLHPVTVIVVIIAGAQVLGILGMIISIPVAGALKVTVSTIYRHLIDTRA